MTETLSAQAPALVANDFVYLLGLPTLNGFLEHLNQLAARRPIDEPKLIDRWLKAEARIRKLRSEEAGHADHPQLAPLPKCMESIAAAHLETLHAQRYMRCGSFAWHMVEIDRLVVYQKTINVSHIARMQAARPRAPSDEELIQIAVGQASAATDVQFTQQADNVFTFASDSSDIRFLEIVPLRPENVRGVNLSGRPAVVIGVTAGFGSNTCSALHYRNRLVLLNASHRLYALRAKGVTHVPCLVQSISSESQLGLVREEIRQNAHLYFSEPRPPMFKDYFNPELHMTVPMTPLKYLVQVQVVHQKLRVPAA